MSDSDEAFESADEGANEQEQQKKTPAVKSTSPAEESKSSSAAGESSAKGKKGKGKRRRSKGQKPAHQEPASPANKSKPAESKAETAEANEQQEDRSNILSEGATQSSNQTGDLMNEPTAEPTVAENPAENIEKDNVEEVSNQSIDRGATEGEEVSEHDREGKRDVTPTRKAERKTKPRAGGSAGDQEEVMNRLAGAADKQKGSGGGWGWGSWGSSILSTATKSVSTFTSQVGEGFTTVLETVESSLGAPSPEEVVQQQRAVHAAKEPSENGAPDSNPASDEEEEAGAVGGQKEEDEQKENVERSSDKDSVDRSSEEKDESAGWFASWGIPSGISKVVESTTKAVENTSKTLVVGGLDVLETIGKKTYDALAEGDHGLKNTIRNTGAKPNLSQILREAKDEADDRAKRDEEFEEARKANFGALFDDFSGLAHLEGLEMVSNQCEGKVQSLLSSMPPEDVSQLKPDLIAIKDEFDMDQHEEDEAEDEVKEHEFKQLVTEHIGNLGLSVTPDKLIQMQGRSRHWLGDTAEEQGNGVRVSAKEIHQMGIQSMAELTACGVESFHKTAQLLQIGQANPINAYKFKASNLKILTLVLNTEVDILSAKFTECLNAAANDSDEPDSINPFITNIYLEASNSKTYIQDAFQLLLPVLQYSALRSHADS